MILYCDNSYIGLTTKQLKKKVKKIYLLALISFRNQLRKKNKRNRQIMNEIKRYAIAEHLVNN